MFDRDITVADHTLVSRQALRGGGGVQHMFHRGVQCHAVHVRPRCTVQSCMFDRDVQRSAETVCL
jgi:hypothetical protein